MMTIQSPRELGRTLGVSRQRADQILNPEKTRARNHVYAAIKRGQLVRPDQCSKCGLGGTIHAHHADYGRPLDVEWLCAGCHGQAHAGQVQRAGRPNLSRGFMPRHPHRLPFSNTARCTGCRQPVPYDELQQMPFPTRTLPYFWYCDPCRTSKRSLVEARQRVVTFTSIDDWQAACPEYYGIYATDPPAPDDTETLEDAAAAADIARNGHWKHQPTSSRATASR